MASSVQTLQKGSTVWAMVKQAKPDATDADVEKVLKANGLTWNSAKTLRTGTKINLSSVLPAEKKPAAAKPASADKTTAQPVQAEKKVDPANTDLAQAAKLLLENLPADALNLNLGDLSAWQNASVTGIPPFWQQLGLSELPQFNAFNLGNFEQLWLKAAGNNTPEMKKALGLANLDPQAAKAMVDKILQGKY